MRGFPSDTELRDAARRIFTERAYLPPSIRAMLLSGDGMDSEHFLDVVATELVDCAHDIPDPRRVHGGPWRPGWRPF